MKIMVSQKIKELYTKSNKNTDYALSCIINSFDPECCERALHDVAEIKFNSEKTPIDVSERTIQEIKELLCESTITNEVVEILLWITVLFPEI